MKFNGLTKTIFLIFLLQLSSLTHSSTVDVCDNLVSIKDDGSYDTIDKCLHSMVCSKKDRVKIVCQLRDVILAKYSLIHLKKERIGLDAKKHLDLCIQGELKFKDNNNLLFLDRIRKCIAGFKDSHFSIRPQLPTPGVFTGIVLKEIGGKFYIARKYPKIIKFVEKKNGLFNLDEYLSVGKEIIEIDGKKPADLLKKYIPFVSGSSDSFIRSQAVEHLLDRNYAYPTKNYVQLKIKLGSSSLYSGKIINLRLPWWRTKSFRIDAVKYFKKVNIPQSDTLKWAYEDNQWVRKGIKSKGYKITDPLIKEGLTTYTDGENNPALRTAIHVHNRHKVFCYMQLLTFSSRKLYKDDDSFEFITPVKDFIKKCNNKDLPLIFDLRSNNGGHASYPAQVLSVLTKYNKKHPNKFTTFRTTAHAAKIITHIVDNDELAARYLSEHMSGPEDFRIFKDEYFKAVESKVKHLPIIAGNNIGHDYEVYGYDEEIIALITPNCISACDMMAKLLKTSKRATLIGTHTNGTGAGFIGTPLVNPLWSDFRDVTKVVIPNILFGIFDDPAPSKNIFPFEKKKKLVMENKPVKADVSYETTLTDLKGESNGWLEKAMSSLFGP